MTEEEIVVWKEFTNGITECLMKALKNNPGEFENNSMAWDMMMDSTIEMFSSSYKQVLRTSSKYGIEKNKVDGFVDIMAYNAKIKLKKYFFE